VPTLKATEAQVSGYAMLGQINFEHPVFAPFADPRYSDFTKIRFWRHRRLDLTGIAEAQVPARFDNGDPALTEVPIGRGRVLILAAGWHPADGQLALSTKFVPMLHALVEYATDARVQATQYAVGDGISLAATANSPLTVLPPDQNPVELTETHFSQTQVPGVYRVRQGTDTWQFVVNLDPAESRTAPLVEDDLERLGVPVRGLTATETSAARSERSEREAELEGRQKLWRWLVLGALVVLGLESWLSGRLTRRRTEAATG
jgi:hypothetical protein